MRLRSPLVCIFSTKAAQKVIIQINIILSKMEPFLEWLIFPHIYIPDVPDFAIVPKFLIKSSFVIPMPLSRIEIVFFSLSNLIWQYFRPLISSVTYYKAYQLKLSDIQCPNTRTFLMSGNTNLDLKLGVITFTQNFFICKRKESNLVQCLTKLSKSPLI